MLLTKEVKVKWNGRNKKHYESFGYVYTKMGDEFVVAVEHLPSRSNHTKVEVQCDYCGKIMLRSWLRYIEGHDEELGDACAKCNTVKSQHTCEKLYGDKNYHNIQQAKQTCLERYGVENPFQMEGFSEKSKQTCLERYGVEHPSQIDGFGDRVKQTKFEHFGDENYNNREQSMQTCLERYGVEHPSQIDGFGDRVKQTKFEHFGDENYNNIEQGKQTKFERYGDENYNNIDQTKQTKFERYGDENYNNIDQAKQTCLERYGDENYRNIEQTKQTCLERYGDENYNNSKQMIQTKFDRYGEYYNNIEQMLETKSKNGTLCTHITFSKPHQYTYGLLCGFYDNENVELEKRVGRYSLDCELIVDDIKIDIEYNGKHWHNGNEEYDNKRREFIINNGYKVLDINSCHSFPTIEQIEKSVNTLTTTNINYISIDLDI